MASKTTMGTQEAFSDFIRFLLLVIVVKKEGSRAQIKGCSIPFPLLPFGSHEALWGYEFLIDSGIELFIGSGNG